MKEQVCQSQKLFSTLKKKKKKSLKNNSAREISYSAVLPTLLKELAGLQVFLFSLKVESDALVVLLRRLRT